MDILFVLTGLILVAQHKGKFVLHLKIVVCFTFENC